MLWGPPVVPKWEAGRVLWRFSLNARVQGAGWLLVWALKEGQHNQQVATIGCSFCMCTTVTAAAAAVAVGL